MRNTNNRGFTLFIAVIITATLLLVSTGIVTLALKQNALTSAARESQYAFYAADTGAECAIYWDVKNSTGISAFATSTGTVITCNSQNFTVGGNLSGVSTILNMNFLPDPYCVTVTVTRYADGSTDIVSRGYNTCDTASSKRVERAVRVSY